jgi:hypothetical protein
MVFMPAPCPIEFRREAVALLKSSGKTVPQLAVELGISPRVAHGYRGARDLEKAAAFFAKESGTR